MPAMMPPPADQRCGSVSKLNCAGSGLTPVVVAWASGEKPDGPEPLTRDHLIVIGGAAVEIGIGVGRAGDAGDDRRNGTLVAGFRRPVEIVAGRSAAGSPGQDYLAVACRSR